MIQAKTDPNSSHAQTSHMRTLLANQASADERTPIYLPTRIAGQFEVSEAIVQAERHPLLLAWSLTLVDGQDWGKTEADAQEREDFLSRLASDRLC